VRASGANWAHYDGNGNVVLLTDGAGAASARYAYDAFGKLKSSSGPAAEANRYRFSTKPQERAAALSYYGYRYYAPAQGRWLSRDPLEEEGGVNLYVCVDNSPVNWTDPVGLTPAGAALGGTIGAGIGYWTGGIIGGAGGAVGGTLVTPGVGTIAVGGIGAAEGALVGGIAGAGLGTYLGDKISDYYNSVRNPWTGAPGSESECNNRKGEKKQTRRYGPDGYPETDTDHDHDHGQGQPHVHDWDRPSSGGKPTKADRGPGRPPKPGDPGIPAPPKPQTP